MTGVGLLLLSGGLLFGGTVVCGGAFSDLWQRMPEVVEVAPPVVVPGTPPRPEPPYVPAPIVIDLDPPRAAAAPTEAPKPSVGATERPRVEPLPQDPLPDAPPIEPLAKIFVEGDAERVIAVAVDGTSTALPAELPRGVYVLMVTFEGQDPFRAGSFAVHDTASRTVQCRANLALCRVR